MAVRQDHGGRHDRSRQGPPADLVDAGDALEAGQPQLAFVAHVRVPRTPVLAAHGPAPNDRSHDEIGHRRQRRSRRVADLPTRSRRK